jgi:hypothetical protein
MHRLLRIKAKSPTEVNLRSFCAVTLALCRPPTKRNNNMNLSTGDLIQKCNNTQLL